MVQRAVPLAEQVRQQLLQWIREERVVEDDGSLPSEAEIAERLGVSRATVRDALSRLERDRIVVRRHGAGTYVNPTIAQLHSSLDVLLDPAALIERQGRRATVGFQEIRWTKVGEKAVAALGISAEQPAVAVAILYLADSRPTIWLESIVPAQNFDGGGAALPAYVNLIQFAGQITGVLTTHSVADLSAVAADEGLARRLSVSPAQSLLCLVDIHLTDDGRPAFYSRTYFVPDIVKLQILRNAEGVTGRVSIW